MFNILKKIFGTSSVVLLSNPAHGEEIPDQDLPRSSERFVHLGLIVGHTEKAQGASMQSGMTEYQYAKKVAEEMVKLLDKYPQVKVSTILRDGIGIHGAYKHAREIGCDCVIEVHFNAYDNKAKGTSTLCTPDTNDVDFAYEVHRGMCDVFLRDGDSRGVQVIGRSVRGAANVYAFPEGVNCLIEPFFGDSEAELGLEKMKDMANSLMSSVARWGRKLDLI